MQGVFENLKSNMKYTLAVKQGTRILAQKTFTTAIHEEWSDEPDPYEEPIMSDDEPGTEPIIVDRPSDGQEIILGVD